MSKLKLSICYWSSFLPVPGAAFIVARSSARESCRALLVTPVVLAVGMLEGCAEWAAPIGCGVRGVSDWVDGCTLVPFELKAAGSSESRTTRWGAALSCGGHRLTCAQAVLELWKWLGCALTSAWDRSVQHLLGAGCAWSALVALSVTEFS